LCEKLLFIIVLLKSDQGSTIIYRKEYTVKNTNWVIRIMNYIT